MKRWHWSLLGLLASFMVMGALAFLGWCKDQTVPMWGYFLGAAVGDLLVMVMRLNTADRRLPNG